jgi:hypothetical protein
MSKKRFELLTDAQWELIGPLDVTPPVRPIGNTIWTKGRGYEPEQAQ